MKISHRSSLTRPVAALLAIGLALSGCGGPAEPNSLSFMEKLGGWQLLFDGESLEGWRGYKLEEVSQGWTAADGAINLTPIKGAVDLVTTGEYADFELVVEWKIAEGGNSGIFFRASEEKERIWHSAVEIQCLDNDNFHGKKIALEHSAGAIYALWPAKREAFRDSGAWNETRVVAVGSTVSAFLNGVEIATYDTQSEDWKKQIAGSKFAKYPGMGELPSGHIALQTHGSATSFRSIKLRPL